MSNTDNQDYDPYNRPLPYQDHQQARWYHVNPVIAGVVGVLVIIAIGYMFLSNSTPQPTPSALNCGVNTLLADRQYDEIVTTCTEAIAVNPNSSAYYNNRGLGYFGQEKYDLALADFNKSIELDPDSGVIYWNRGELYFALEDYNHAIQDYTAAVRNDPRDTDAYLSRAWALYIISEYERALDDANMAVSLAPSSPETLNIRGLVFTNLNSYVEAIADFDAALQISPNDVDILYNRARAHNAADDTGKATEDLNKILTLTDDPDLTKSVQESLQDMASK